MSSKASFLLRLFLFYCLQIAGSAHAADSPVLLVVGDSLSSGYRIDTENSWPVLLEQRLQASGRTVRVVNASRKGATAEDGRKRLKALLARNQPRWVILELGANDGLRRGSLSSLRNNIDNMLAMVRSSGAVPILVGMRLPPNYDSAYANEFAALYVRMARESDTVLTPFLLERIANHPELFQADHLHPNAEAQPLLLESVWASVDAVISPR
ncbi:MAG: arylesterase [Ignavibacteria bacterium]